MKRLLTIFLIMTICILSVLPVMPVAYAAEESNDALISYLIGDLAFSADGVTRAEFAAGLIRLAYEKAPAASEASFKDVAAAHPYAAEIYTALSMGIISRSDSFNPDGQVTYAQAMKMAVSMLGYGTLAESRGGYPTGYLSYAQRSGLTLAGKGNDEVLLPADAKAILAKTAEADMLAVSELGTYEQNAKTNILSNVRGIYKARGVITATAQSSLYSANGAVRKGFVLGAESFVGSVPSGYLGYYATVYYEKDVDGVKTACIVIPENNDIVTLLGRDCEPIRGNVLTDIDGNEYTLDAAHNLIYNGKAYSKTDGKKFLKGADVKLTLIDAGEDGTYETILVEEAAYMQVSRIENGIGGKALYDNETKNSMVSLFGDIDYEVYADGENGLTEIPFEQIAIGDLVATYSSEDKKMVKVVLCNKSVTGAVSSVSRADKSVVIGDVKYPVNDVLGSLWGNIVLGAEQEYLLDESGRITAIGVASANAMYGWIVAAKKDGKSGLSSSIILKIFTEEGEMEVLPLADRVVVDGTTVSVNSLSETTFNNLADNMRLVRFKKSTAEQPKITMIDYPTTPIPSSYVYMEKPENANDSMIRNFDFQTMKNESNIGVYDAADGRTLGRFRVGGRTKMFCIPEPGSRRNDDKNYVIGTGGIANGYEYPFAAYDIDVYAVAGAIVALTKSSSASALDYSNVKFGIVESVATTVNEDFEQIPIVYVAYLNNITPYYLDEDIVSVASTLNPGDTIRFNSFKEGYINVLVKDYDFNSNTYTKSAYRGGSYGHIDVGWIYSANNLYINLMPEGKTTGLTSSDITALNYAGNYTTVTYVYVKPATDSKPAKVSIRFEPLQEVRDYITSGQQADRALVYGAYNNTTNVVIYRFN